MSTSGTEPDHIDSGDVVIVSDASMVTEVGDDDSVIVISSDCSPIKVFSPSKRQKSLELDSDDEPLMFPVKKRLKFASSSESEEERDPTFTIDYFDSDPDLPIISKLDHGYPVHLLIQELLSSDANNAHICKVQPLGVMKNAVFQIDLDVVPFGDLKADDLGSWNATGTKRTHFRFTKENSIRYATGVPSASTSYFCLTRRYYVHKTCNRFHRIISDIKDGSGAQHRYCMLQYYFDGPETEIKIKPHGNAKSNIPFFRTSDSAKKFHKEVALTHKPKDAIYQATKAVGGEYEARGLSSLPRNRQQISNYRRNETKRDDNVLYSVMLECKLAQGTQEAFVRDVKSSPEPECVLFLDWQLADMERFLVEDGAHGILTIDPTYNLGQFYVTPTTYPHLLLQDIITRKHPALLGPVLVHQRMDFSSFNYFVSTLIGFNKKLRNVKAFGTDGQEALIDAFGHSFSAAVQLRCFIHMKKNIAEKLKEYGVPSSVAQEFINDIFGKHCGSTYYEGLVDSISEDQFNERLVKCENLWNAREAPYAPLGGPRFFDYFYRYKSSAVCHNMRRDIRESVGLGSPPAPFTTNASESINALLKRKVNYKQSEWPQFNAELKEVVRQQHEEIVRALSGRGQFRLLPQYSHYSVDPTKWARMKPEQRRDVVSKFNKAAVKSMSSTSQSGMSSGHAELMVGQSSMPTHPSSLIGQPSESTISALLVGQPHVSAAPNVTAPGSFGQRDVLAVPASIGQPNVSAAPASIGQPNVLAASASPSVSAVPVSFSEPSVLASLLSQQSVAVHVPSSVGQSSGSAPSRSNQPSSLSGQTSIPAHSGVLFGIRKNVSTPTSTTFATVAPARKRISVSPEGSGITKLTVSTLQCIWKKAEELINNSNAITPAPGSLSAKMVLSHSSPVPHLVAKASGGQYKCDSQCLNWASSGICSHCLAVAQTNGEVVTFLKWYNASSQQPNITTLAMAGLPSGRGCKGGKPKRVRNRMERKTPEQSIPRPVFQETTSSSEIAVQGAGQPAMIQSAVVGQVNVGSVSSTVSHSALSLGQVPTQLPNTNPFYVKFICGNIRMCQGCRSSVRSRDGSVPAPPFDLVIARAERRTFRDKSGVLITPYREQASHYHIRLDCVRNVEPSFVPLSLKVPQDVLPLLTGVHTEYMKLVFGLRFQ